MTTKVTGMMQTSTKGGDIPSASPCVIDTDGDYFDVTGTTNFAAFTVVAGRRFTIQFDGALTMTHHATNIDLPGGANITTAAGDVAEFFATGTNTVQCVNYTKADGTAVVSASVGATTNALGGLKTSNGTDAAHDIDIAVGFARDYSDSAEMVLGSVLTKQIDAGWSVGSGAGGLDTGSVAAHTGYGVYLIRRSDTGVVDAMFSLDMTPNKATATFPTNYDQHRLIGWVKTDAGSNILSFIQSGDTFRIMGALVKDIDDTSITSNTFETATLDTPPLCHVVAIIYIENSGNTDLRMSIHIKTKGASEDSEPRNGHLGFDFDSGAVANEVHGQLAVLSDSAGQIEYLIYENSGSARFEMKIIGMRMDTRRNP